MLYYLGLFMTGLLLKPDSRGLRTAVWMFIAGAAAQAVWDLVRVPVLVMRFGVNLYDTGNMRDPQMYLVALCLLMAMLLFRRDQRRPGPLFYAALLLNAAGLVIHFKRGVWISFFIALFLLVLMTRRWKVLLAAALVAGSLVFVPQVQQRLSGLKDEFRTGQGGRMALWADVAPALISEHPLGMGYCATRNEDFTPHTAYVQPKLTHVHNNILQMILELGWQGLAVWILWMGVALVSYVRLLRDPALDASGDRWAAAGGLAALAGLLLNGMVEYNFGDSEILMVYCFLMGVAILLQRRSRGISAV
ncbi:MAG: O-antigen ligase family protein [Kiritimatiellia bacterium]